MPNGTSHTAPVVLNLRELLVDRRGRKLGQRNRRTEKLDEHGGHDGPLPARLTPSAGERRQAQRAQHAERQVRR